MIGDNEDRETAQEEALVCVRGCQGTNGKEETSMRDISKEDLGRTGDWFKMGRKIKEDAKCADGVCQSWETPLICLPFTDGKRYKARRHDFYFIPVEFKEPVRQPA